MTIPEDLTGRLLVATPEIEDGIFCRSVVLVLHHGTDGAQGVVLNKPLEAEVEAILPGWGAVATLPAMVFQGGPVQMDSALGLVSLGDLPPADSRLRRLFGSIGLVDLDSDPQVISGQVCAVRIFAGYAGWSANQLEGEIVAGSWYVVEREPADAFAAGTDLWRAVLARQPGPLAFVAAYPADPGLN
ncbi:YqgE/AlgH family protein [Nostocoides australiense]|uniref:Uncharacterized protein n=1 Tax=Nostocoides australiense Ben110 TaxID=1193182 RepID=W6JSS1_9MICO|nr:YqgE/AlgH family protein [Tetrasphaera australiensis]MCA0291667.1 YqgE/AlgH family protein [Actinomycetota bacterium]MCB1300237.1 YqgE/AlgH family protein [Tetrasphaera sp.]CCH72138.1 conserved hypothetical protein [Tetrasphaera australiensis Ben110]HPF81151.1 YqgE/AlgH family protein [Tetrasphaera australiensis]HRW01510.1 YqgE/AlgH family protein [Tetrasphaera sp.]